jgi:predicted thioredoxin/glutaredoxin
MAIETREQSRLRVYVAKQCRGCAEALRIVARIRREIPEVAIEVIDLDEDRVIDGDAVFSVPTWVLDGRTLSLGNPDAEELMRLLSSRRNERR